MAEMFVELVADATHTNRYLDFYSHHYKQHKISATDALRFNNYPQNVISNILKKKSSTQRTNSISTPEELVCMFFKWAAPSDFSNYAVLPYINRISQPLTRLL